MASAWSNTVRSTTASGSMVYESERAVNEYLQYQYGAPVDVMPFSNGPMNALTFLKQTVLDCATRVPKTQRRRRALDVGCAVGGSTFELSQYFDEVRGIDFSHGFIDAAKRMQSQGQAQYMSTLQGQITLERTCRVPNELYQHKDKITFEQGDACDLSQDLGQFDAVLASNLLCRLPDPTAFLNRLSSLVHPGGIVALISPYSWLEEYTPKDKWLGGYISKEQHGGGGGGGPVDSFETIHGLLRPHFELVHRANYPFLIREHERKYQWGISDGCFWQRRY